jgi:flagellar motility protein MotE (MotC chaperone)
LPVTIFLEFKDLLRSYPSSKLLRTQDTYAVKSSLIGRITAERLVEQEKVNAQLSRESKEIKRNFVIAQSSNLDLEKKVAELAETLKHYQDERKATGEDAENSRKKLERLRKTHDEALVRRIREISK